MQYKYLGTAARTEPVIMAPGDIVTLEPDQAQPLLQEGFLMEVVEQEPLKATEAAQKLAESEGIDLHTIVATGADGQITHDDVHKAVVAKHDTESHEEGEQA